MQFWVIALPVFLFVGKFLYDDTELLDQEAFIEAAATLSQDTRQHFVFLSFASPAYGRTLRLLEGEAADLGVFHSVLAYRHSDLQTMQPFWNDHKEFIERHTKKGYGFYIWKPWLVWQTLKVNMACINYKSGV